MQLTFTSIRFGIRLLHIDAANLILKLENKVTESYLFEYRSHKEYEKEWNHPSECENLQIGALALRRFGGL